MSTTIERVGDDLRMTRVFAAPVELVFSAWTEPERVQAWWGCANTRKVVSTIDLRVGGKFTHVMQIDGAGECTVEGVITELDPPRRLAWFVAGGPVEGGPDMPPMPDMPDTTTTVELADHPDGTELRLTVTGLAGTPYADIVQGGWSAGLEKLSAAVAP